MINVQKNLTGRIAAKLFIYHYIFMKKKHPTIYTATVVRHYYSEPITYALI